MRQSIIPLFSWQKSSHPFVQQCVSEALNSAGGLIKEAMHESAQSYRTTFRNVKVKFMSACSGGMQASAYFLNGDPGANIGQFFYSLPVLSKVHVELKDAENNVFAFAYVIALLHKPGMEKKKASRQRAAVADPVIE